MAPPNDGTEDRRKTMKTMILAAAAVLALGVGSAFAGDGDGWSATTKFTSIPGQQAVVAQSAPSQTAPSQTATATNEAGVTHTYVTKSHAGTWLFPPDMVGGGGN
jgi:hypothetical protein